MNKGPTILVTGAAGQLGRALKYHSQKANDWTWIFLGRDQLDLSNPKSIDHFFDQHKIDYCINCAAYTQVDKAESESELAFKINCEAVDRLARNCKTSNARLVHISTDYIYDNGLIRPLIETDPISPRSVYANSKKCGEDVISKSLDEYIILRTSWLYAPWGHNFVNTMLRLGQLKDELSIVNDQTGSPTSCLDLADGILQMIDQIETNGNKPEYFGVFNFANNGETSWAEFAKKIFQLADIECQVDYTTTEEFGALAPRPAYSVMNLDKLSTVYGITPPHWTKSLADCLELKGILQSNN